MEDSVIEKTAVDYAAYFDIDVENKLKPINQSVDEMLTRLDEYRTMVSVAQKERETSTEVFKDIEGFSENFKQLCTKIDVVEKLVAHIKTNLNTLEANIEKADQELGITDNAAKVTNILLPIFKKSPEKVASTDYVELFKTEDYFQPSTQD